MKKKNKTLKEIFEEAFGNYKKGDFKIAENQAKKLITLPIHQFIQGEQIKYVIKTITKFYNSN